MIITSQKQLQAILSDIDTTLPVPQLVNQLNKKLLQQKIRFPLLEYATRQFSTTISPAKQFQLAAGIMKLKTIGGNVLVGILLQQQLQKQFSKAIAQAIKHIIYGNEWYVCDIIAERVLGKALLNYPAKTLPALKKIARNPNKWAVRSTGVAGHYAIKNGLEKKHVKQYFSFLISQAITTDFHTKKGIGWAVKTTAKFHPDIIGSYSLEIEKNSDIKQWFKTKIKIGLSRTSKYANRYNR